MQEQVPLMNNEVRVKYLPQGERREDIISLVREFIKLSEEQVHTGPKELSKDVEEYLLSYDW
jgi:DNA-binding NtrC family response regulator